MKHQWLVRALVASVICVMGVSAQAGGGKGGGKGTVEVVNGNSFDDEDGDIRVWLLSETDPVPTTKAEADELESVSTPPTSIGAFVDLDGGDYILVAANESHYQSLADEDSISAGVDYSAESLVLAEDETQQFQVINSSEEGKPPVITQGQGPAGPDGPGGPPGPGGPMGPGGPGL